MNKVAVNLSNCDERKYFRRKYLEDNETTSNNFYKTNDIHRAISQTRIKDNFDKRLNVSIQSKESKNNSICLRLCRSVGTFPIHLSRMSKANKRDRSNVPFERFKEKLEGDFLHFLEKNRYNAILTGSKKYEGHLGDFYLKNREKKFSNNLNNNLNLNNKSNNYCFNEEKLKLPQVVQMTRQNIKNDNKLSESFNVLTTSEKVNVNTTTATGFFKEEKKKDTMNTSYNKLSNNKKTYSENNNTKRSNNFVNKNNSSKNNSASKKNSLLLLSDRKSKKPSIDLRGKEQNKMYSFNNVSIAKSPLIKNKNGSLPPRLPKNDTQVKNSNIHNTPNIDHISLQRELDLTPIPQKTSRQSLNVFQYIEAERAAVTIRRIEYSFKMKDKKDNSNKVTNQIYFQLIFEAKTILIQRWWRRKLGKFLLNFCALRIQKSYRGFLIRMAFKLVWKQIFNVFPFLQNIFFIVKKRMIKNYFRKIFKNYAIIPKNDFVVFKINLIKSNWREYKGIKQIKQDLIKRSVFLLAKQILKFCFCKINHCSILRKLEKLSRQKFMSYVKKILYLGRKRKIHKAIDIYNINIKRACEQIFFRDFTIRMLNYKFFKMKTKLLSKSIIKLIPLFDLTYIRKAFYIWKQNYKNYKNKIRLFLFLLNNVTRAIAWSPLIIQIINYEKTIAKFQYQNKNNYQINSYSNQINSTSINNKNSCGNEVLLLTTMIINKLKKQVDYNNMSFFYKLKIFALNNQNKNNFKKLAVKKIISFFDKFDIVRIRIYFRKLFNILTIKENQLNREYFIKNVLKLYIDKKHLKRRMIKQKYYANWKRMCFGFRVLESADIIKAYIRKIMTIIKDKKLLKLFTIIKKFYLGKSLETEKMSVVKSKFVKWKEQKFKIKENYEFLEEETENVPLIETIYCLDNFIKASNILTARLYREIITGLKAVSSAKFIQLFWRTRNKITKFRRIKEILLVFIVELDNNRRKVLQRKLTAFLKSLYFRKINKAIEVITNFIFEKIKKSRLKTLFLRLKKKIILSSLMLILIDIKKLIG